jgi:DNA polymerase sigma
MCRLNQEIFDFVEYMKPTLAEHSMRELVIARIQTVIKRTLPSASVEIFGSYRTKLYLPSSDLDLVILGDENYGKNAMYKVADALAKARIPSKIEVIDSAKVHCFGNSLLGPHC